MTWVMLVILILSISIWYLTLDRIPSNLRLMTAEVDGLYHYFGQHFQAVYQETTGQNLEEIPSAGSVENAQALRNGQAELAILQGGSTSLHGLAILAPLYHEVVHLIARTDRGIHSLEDLAGRTVFIGQPESGMRASATTLLEHFNLADKINPSPAPYFTALVGDDSTDAAIITTGILNPDLKRLLRSGQFELLPIPDTSALVMRDAFFQAYTIPRGLYGERPGLPDRDVPVIATTAFLAVAQDTGDRIVESVLHSLYESGLWIAIPTMIPRSGAAEWNQMPLHPAARNYFNPSDDIGRLANIMESMAAIKELLFALGAGLYLLWDRWRRIKEKELKREMEHAKEHLDSFMMKTLEIERAQMQCTQSEELKAMLDTVTRIKLQALQELTHEELRGDRMFQIFLIQCGNLINKIQSKISTEAMRHYVDKTHSAKD